MRAILDPNLIISSLLSPKGAPAAVLRAWLEGRFELVVSPLFLAELRRALSYPKLRERVRPDEAATLVAWLGREASMLDDPEEPPETRSSDRGDDYLLALAERARAVLVSGDQHLLALSAELPVLRPREFLATVGGRQRRD